jgi:DNA-binding CsgD family transcriptional regulator/PAS domain-containing protein
LDQISQLIGIIYQSAFDPTQWELVLKDLSDLMNGRCSLLLVHDKNTKQAIYQTNHNLHPEYMTNYIGHYYAYDLWRGGCESAAEGDVICGRELVEREAFFKSVWYNDFLIHQDIGEGTMGIVENNDRYFVGTNVCQSFQDDGIDDEQKKLVGLLLPHIRQALRQQFDLQLNRATENAYQGLLDDWGLGTFLLDASGRSIWMNKAANQLIGPDAEFELKPGGILKLADGHQDRSFQKQLAAILCKRREGVFSEGSSMSITKASGRRALQITISNVDPDRCGALLNLGATRPSIVVYVRDPDETPLAPSGLLQEIFGLTAAEAAFVAEFVKDASLAGAADRLSLTKSSARTYMKRVFSKTDVNSQTELMKLLLMLPAMPKRG